MQTRGLTRDYKRTRAVDGLNLSIQPSELFGLVDPNGAGKTTAIRMVLGLLPPSAGTIEVLGVPATEHPERIRPRVGYMAQRFSLYNDLTVLQNLRFYGRAYGLENDVLERRIQEALELTDLQGRAHAKTGDLSGGWRQRLALNAAILHRPGLVFLDEPTAGVDPISRRAFWDLLYRLVVEGITVFVTTHYMDEAEHCHRLAFIQHGRLIASGSPESIKRDVMPGKVLEIAPDDIAGAVEALRAASAMDDLSIREVAMYGPRVHVTGEDVGRQREAIAAVLRQAGVEPKEMAVIEPSLEDVFVACMR